MVASFLNQKVSKTYVRLPGTGSDKAADASFCDLSRGSRLAACIPVPQHVGTPRCQTAKLAPNTVTSTTHKRPRTEDDTVDTNVSNKRLRIDSANQNPARTEDGTVDTNVSNKRLRIDSTNQNPARSPSDHTSKPATAVPAAPVTKSPQVIGSNFVPTNNIANNEPVRQTQTPTKFFIISNTVCDVPKLQEENAQLKSENATLQKQLSLFKQLIRNPQRLNSVLQRLNERLNE